MPMVAMEQDKLKRTADDTANILLDNPNPNPTDIHVWKTPQISLEQKLSLWR